MRQPTRQSRCPSAPSGLWTTWRRQAPRLVRQSSAQGLRRRACAARRFTRRTLESLAAAKDLGFNLAVLRDAFGVLDDLPRSAFEVDDATFDLLRTEFHAWRDEIGDSLAG